MQTAEHFDRALLEQKLDQRNLRISTMPRYRTITRIEQEEENQEGNEKKNRKKKRRKGEKGENSLTRSILFPIAELVLRTPGEELTGPMRNSKSASRVDD